MVNLAKRFFSFVFKWISYLPPWLGKLVKMVLRFTLVSGLELLQSGVSWLSIEMAALILYLEDLVALDWE